MPRAVSLELTALRNGRTPVLKAKRDMELAASQQRVRQRR